MNIELLRKLHQDRPFQPFDLHLADGRTVQVLNAESLAIFPTGKTIIITFDDSWEVITLSSVVSFGVMPTVWSLARKRAMASLALIERVLGDCSLSTNKPSESDAKWHMVYLELLSTFSLLAYRALRSMLVLLDSHLSEDSTLHLRQLIELLINAQFINLQWRERTELYQQYGVVIRKKASDAVARLPDPEMRSSFQHLLLHPDCETLSRYEAVKGNYPDKNRWSGKPIIKMAKDCEFDALYEIVYRLCSSFTHGDVLAHGRIRKFEKPNCSVLILGENPENYSNLLTLANLLVLLIVSLFNDEAKLGFDDSLTELRRQFQVPAKTSD